MSTLVSSSEMDQPIVQRPNVAAVGTVVWLSSELMFFAGLFAIYFTLRSTRPDEWIQESSLLNIPYSLINTIVLVLSSVTCQMGVFAAERTQGRRFGKIFDVQRWGVVEWFMLTFVMGAFFVAGQVGEYAQLIAEGVTLSSNAYGSIFYIATGFHGLHVLGGLIAFLFVIARTFMARRFGDYEATSAIVLSYYWHFVDVVWIGLFSVIYLLR